MLCNRNAFPIQCTIRLKVKDGKNIYQHMTNQKKAEVPLSIPIK